MAKKEGIAKQERPKRRNISSPVAVEAETTGTPEAVLSEPSTDTPEPEKKTRASITIALKEDGSIDMDSMRDSTKDKLTRALGASHLVATITGNDVAFIYDGLGSVESWAAVKFFGVPAEYANLFLYSKDEKETLAEPTAKCLQKWVPTMSKFKDEATLILTLYSIHQNKILTLQAHMEQKAKLEAAGIRPGPISIQPETERPQ